MTLYGPRFAQQFADPVIVAVEPRLAVQTLRAQYAGKVTDADGKLLMFATPMTRQFESDVHYTDDKLVLGVVTPLAGRVRCGRCR